MNIIKKIAVVALIATTSVCAENDLLPSCDQWAIQSLYQMMKDMHELFELYDVQYWVDGGTLLGAVRHKGLIPWDDDLDVCVPKTYERKLVLMQPHMQALGYQMVRMPFGFKIYSTQGRPIGKYPWNYPFFDIFLMDYRDGKFFLTMQWNAKREGASIYVREDEIYPLKNYVFGPIVVVGPNNPYPILTSWYGDDWNKIGYRGYDHAAEKKVEIKPVLLTREDKKSAKITEPLLDRVRLNHPKLWPTDFQDLQVRT